MWALTEGLVNIALRGKHHEKELTSLACTIVHLAIKIITNPPQVVVVVKHFYLINIQYQLLLIRFIRNPDTSER